MNPFGITEKSYKLLVNTIFKYFEVEDVLVFGSRAKGNFKKGSDIDLAIKGKRCNERIAMNIKGYVNEELPIPYHIDIVFYDGLKDSDLKEHIDRVGVRLFEAERISMVNEQSESYKKP